jgi:hypothetical protein
MGNGGEKEDSTVGGGFYSRARSVGSRGLDADLRLCRRRGGGARGAAPARGRDTVTDPRARARAVRAGWRR